MEREEAALWSSCLGDLGCLQGGASGAPVPAGCSQRGTELLFKPLPTPSSHPLQPCVTGRGWGEVVWEAEKVAILRHHFESEVEDEKELRDK